MQRGYSRDNGPDCKQLVIAPIVNVEGFPLSYETFDGNPPTCRVGSGDADVKAQGWEARRSGSSAVAS
jgi:hypothetical protein